MSNTWTDHLDAETGSKLYRDGEGNEVSIIARGDHVEAHCHGPSEHFRPDGGCEHMDGRDA